MCGCHPWHCQPCFCSGHRDELDELDDFDEFLMSLVVWAELLFQGTPWERIPDGKPGKCGSVGGSPQIPGAPGSWSEQEPSEVGEHQVQGVQVGQGGVPTPAPDQGPPQHLPLPPVEPLDREEAAGAALACCWLCPRAEPPAGSFHPGSISSRAPGGISSDLSSLGSPSLGIPSKIQNCSVLPAFNSPVPNSWSLVFLRKAPIFTALEILDHNISLCMMCLLTSLLFCSSLHFASMFYSNVPAVPQELLSSNNNCRGNKINHPGATCICLVTFLAFLIRAGLDQMRGLDIFL